MGATDSADDSTNRPMSFLCSLCSRPHPLDESEYTCLSCRPAGILEPVGFPYLDEDEEPDYEN
jgi:hypothetical protein